MNLERYSATILQSVIAMLSLSVKLSHSIIAMLSVSVVAMLSVSVIAMLSVSVIAMLSVSVIAMYGVSLHAFEPPLGESTTEQSAGDSLVVALLQDEPESGEIPAENRIAYTRSRNEVGIQLDAYGMTGVEFEGIELLVLGPTQKKSTYKPDGEGLVMVKDVAPGPHVLVAMGEHYHGAHLLFLEENAEKPETANGIGPLSTANAEAPEVARMTILEIARKDVASFVNRTRGGRLGRIRQNVRTGARHGYQVSLRPDGTIHGRLISVRESNVPKNFAGSTIGIFRDGDLVAVTRSDEQGFWRAADLQPGLYGLIAAGPEGYVAFAFEVTANDEVAQHGKRERLVSILQNVPSVLPCVLIPPMFLPKVSNAIDSFYEQQELLRSELSVEQSLSAESGGVPFPGVPVPPIFGANGGGGGAGSGVTGAGVGGAGAITAAIATAAAAAASNEDGRIVPPPPASPFRP